MVLGHQEHAYIAVVAICSNQNRAIRKGAILKVCPHATDDFFYSRELLAILDNQPICEDVAQLLTV